MNAEKLADAIGMINDEKITEARSFKPKSRITVLRKAVVMAASLCLALLLLTAASAAQPIYRLVYMMSPELAKAMRPVELCCRDEGISAEVISASVSGNEAAVYIAVKDESGKDRIDETADLYDSYKINSPFDSSATCRLVTFDETTKTAYFLIYISLAEGNNIDGDRITFSFSRILTNKDVYDGYLTELDMKNAAIAEKTQMPDSFRGGGGKEFDYENRYETGYLVPVDGGIFSPVDGVTVTNFGFIDGKLHIQLYYEDVLSYDNHGYIKMENVRGESAECTAFSFWDEGKKGSYDELIYDISPSELENYTPYGYFVTCDTLIEGKWKVTFPLENMQ